MRMFLAVAPMLLLFGCHLDPLTTAAIPADADREPEVENPVTGPRSLEFSGFQAVNFRREKSKKNPGGFSFKLRSAGQTVASVACEGFLVPSPFTTAPPFRGHLIDESGATLEFSFQNSFVSPQIELASGETVDLKFEILEDEWSKSNGISSYARWLHNGEEVGRLVIDSLTCSVEPDFPEDMRVVVAGTLAGFYFNIMEHRARVARNRIRTSGRDGSRH